MKAFYIHEKIDWPDFYWDNDLLQFTLGEVRKHQGKLLGKMEALGFSLREEALLKTLTLDVVKSSEIEGEFLNLEQVRSSVARRLGMNVSGLIASDRNVDGIVDVLVDATTRSKELLTKERLCSWHTELFPEGKSGMYDITVGDWRKDEKGPMQVVSGALGQERVHFVAPAAKRLKNEMDLFLEWFNEFQPIDPVIKAAIAHFWLVTIHPFDDGNGRIARAVADMQLARADGIDQRFYSMSAQLRIERKKYYELLEKTQCGELDLSSWINWFLECLRRTLEATENVLSSVLLKASFWERHRGISINLRQQKMLNKLLDDFEGKLTSSKWAKISKCSPDSALRDIQDLIDKRVLKKEEAGGRSTSYILSF